MSFAWITTALVPVAPTTTAPDVVELPLFSITQFLRVTLLHVLLNCTAGPADEVDVLVFLKVRYWPEPLKRPSIVTRSAPLMLIIGEELATVVAEMVRMDAASGC